jgi:hypothetical protein
MDAVPMLAKTRLGLAAIPAVCCPDFQRSRMDRCSASADRSAQGHVESIVDGHGVQTNEIYPVAIRHEMLPLPRPFVHNILNTYLAAGPAVLLGAYEGWIALNFLSGLLTAFLIFRTVVSVTDSRPAASAVAATYLVLPLTIWLTTQPMAEASIAPLAALAVISTPRGCQLLALDAAVHACAPVYCRELCSLLPWFRRAMLRIPAYRRSQIGGAADLSRLVADCGCWGNSCLNRTSPVVPAVSAGRPNVSNMNTYFD